MSEAAKPTRLSVLAILGRCWRPLVRVQGYAFFPMLLLEGANLHWQSIRTYLTGTGIKGRWSEGSVFLVLYLGVLFWFLPVGLAFAFLGVQLAVFGFYMGIAFAPNHKGMPIIEEGQKVDFFSRQVVTSRNIHGGRWVEHFMGGLNYQVEHHLFPNMARPNLRAARLVVRRFCAEQNVPYTRGRCCAPTASSSATSTTSASLPATRSRAPWCSNTAPDEGARRDGCDLTSRGVLRRGGLLLRAGTLHRVLKPEPRECVVRIQSTREGISRTR